MNLGQLIFEARKSKNLTLRDVELITGISNPAISQIENGEIKNPGWFTVIKLLKFLNISIDEALNVSNEQIKTEKEIGELKTIFHLIEYINGKYDFDVVDTFYTDDNKLEVTYFKTEDTREIIESDNIGEILNWLKSRIN